MLASALARPRTPARLRAPRETGQPAAGATSRPTPRSRAGAGVVPSVGRAMRQTLWRGGAPTATPACARAAALALMRRARPPRLLRLPHCKRWQKHPCRRSWPHRRLSQRRAPASAPRVRAALTPTASPRAWSLPRRARPAMHAGKCREEAAGFGIARRASRSFARHAGAHSPRRCAQPPAPTPIATEQQERTRPADTTGSS